MHSYRILSLGGISISVPVVGLITMQALMCSMSEPESPGEWYPDMRESFRNDV